MLASRRTILSALLIIGSTSPSFASFDLMYIPTPSLDRITRYDPVNRVFLGGITAPNVTQVVYGGGQYGQAKINAGSNFRFDFFGGNGAGFAPHTVDSYDYINNQGIFSTGTGINIVDIANRSQTSLALAGASGVFRANILSNGNILALSSIGGNITGRIHTSAGALASTFNVLSSITLTRVSNALVTTNRGGNGVFSLVLLDSTNTYRHLKIQTTPGGTFAGMSSSNLTAFSTSTSVSLAPAHDGSYIVGGDSVNPGTLTRFLQYDDEGYGSQWNTWTENLVPTGVQSVYSIGMVLAPEPAMFAPMGLGLAALALRKRRIRG